MIAVFDNFIKDEQLLNEIAQAEQELFGETGKYKYWKGWWTKPASNIGQKLAQYIWGDNFPLAMLIEADGFLVLD